MMLLSNQYTHVIATNLHLLQAEFLIYFHVHLNNQSTPPLITQQNGTLNLKKKRAGKI